MRLAIAILLVLHGFAHLVGFVGSWRLAESIPYRTTAFDGAVDLGDAGIRVVGVLWLAAALAFAATAVAVLYRVPAWPAVALLVCVASLLLCIVAWPEARAGAVLNAALIVTLLAGMRLDWFAALTR